MLAPRHRLAFPILVAVAIAAARSGTAQKFVNITNAAGLQNVSKSLGGDGAGLCCGDFDGDGDLDIVVPGPNGTPIQFFRNDGGLTFSAITGTGLGNATEPRGITCADVDNDGDQDILVTNWRLPLQLFINDGTATFVDEANTRGLTSLSSAHTASFGDYDRDGWLDLVIANREDQSTNSGERNLLYRNAGNGTFVDVSQGSGADNAGLSYVTVFVDYNEDLWPDIYIANDKGTIPGNLPNTLLRNNGNGTFTDVGSQLGAEQAIDGMGVDFVDAFNDGGVDLYCSDTPVDHLFLRWDPTQDLYLDNTYKYALAGGGFGWAVNFLDVDNDGWQDLYVVHTGSPNALFQNPAAVAGSSTAWPEVAFPLGLTSFFSQYVTIVGDFDNDGGVDVCDRFALVPQLPQLPGAALMHNQLNRGNWLKVVPRGVASNRDGIGARIEVTTGSLTQRQYRRNGAGYLSSSDQRVHFGVGNANLVDHVTITWPSGQVQYLDNVPVNQILEVTEPSFTLAAPVAVGGTSTLDLNVQGDEGLLYGMVLAFAKTPRSQLIDGRFLPLALDGLSSYTFIPGNLLLGNPLNFLDAFGNSSSSVTIPNTPGLAGITLYATAATVPPQGLPAIRTIFPTAVAITIQ